MGANPGALWGTLSRGTKLSSGTSARGPRWAGRLLAFGLGCLLLVATRPAAAWELDGVAAWRQLGPDVELGKPERLHEHGGGALLGGLRFGVGLRPWLHLELAALGGRTELPVVEEGGTGFVAATLLEARVNLRAGPKFGRFEPFVLIGGAVSQTLASGGPGGEASDVLTDRDLSSHAGVGLRVRLLAGLHLRADARLSLVGSTVKGQLFSRDLGATVGLGWAFGAGAEPGTPAVPRVAGPEPIAGDSDGDRIGDGDDRCPLEPETRNGLRDDDGCPEDPEVARRYHQNGYDVQGTEIVATLRSTANKPAAAASTGAAVARDPRLLRLDPPVPLAKDALPPLVSPGDDDGDGIVRADDACPDEAEDPDGFADEDGCPDLDDDGDGILDVADRCPLESETVNGARDEDGCPEDPELSVRAHRTRYARAADGGLVAAPPDQALPEPEKLGAGALPALASNGDDDGDGLLRQDDVCPELPEDKDGFEDGDGCPDPDNDGDGVLDGADRCALEGETRNGWDDEDGCPDLLPAVLLERVGRIEGLVFANNSAKLLPASEPVLQKLLAALKEYPQIRVEIAGHTDDRGKRARNIELSRQRAESVRDWLVAKGVEADHLQAAGYGPDVPVTSNRNEKGRALNRRVEFNLVVVPAKPVVIGEEVGK